MVSPDDTMSTAVAAGDVRLHASPDLPVVSGQNFLRDARVAPVDAVGMGEGDLAHCGAAPFAAGRAPRPRVFLPSVLDLTHHITRRLVIAHALE